MKLEAGTVEALYNSQTSNPLYKAPVLQITSLGKLSVAVGDKQRYRVNLSDGINYMKGIFSSELTPHFENGRISKLSLIMPEKFSVRTKDGSVYIYIQDIAEYEDCNVEVGKPVNISTGSASFHENNSNGAVREARPAEAESLKRLKKEDGGFMPISMLNPFHNKWTIKGRVSSKSDIKRFTNQKGEGKLFSFELSDATAQVRVTCFSECVDIFYPLVETGKVYALAKGTVKMANKQYSSNPFDYEIVLDKNSEIRHISDDDVPRFFFSFTSISQLVPGSTLYDTIGVVREAYPVSTVVIRSTQKEQLKRDVVLVDQSGSARLTLWGPKAEMDLENNPVLALRSVKVSDYNGVSISTISMSQVLMNPDIPEAHTLVGWYQSVGKDNLVVLPRREEKRRLVQEMKENELPYSTIQGTVLFIKEDALWYESCQGEGCNKKVMLEDNGSYRCERCNRTYPECNYRYMLTMHIADFTGQLWISLFDEVAASFFGIPAKEMREMMDSNPSQLQSLIKGMYFREFFFRIKARQESYNNEVRMRYSAIGVTQVDILKETRKLLETVQSV
jgi:replication factor A1